MTRMKQWLVLALYLALAQTAWGQLPAVTLKTSDQRGQVP